VCRSTESEDHLQENGSIRHRRGGALNVNGTFSAKEYRLDDTGTLSAINSIFSPIQGALL
jgi:hypothetical protein